MAIIGFAATLPGIAQGAVIEAGSRVDHVTLYPDAALVTRIVTVEIPAGAHEIALSDLPQALDPASLRVEGAADARITLGGIDFRLRPAAPRVEAELERKLKTLRTERDRILDRLDATEGRKAMILRLSQGGEGKDQRPLDIEQFMKAAEAVGRGLQSANEELRGLRIEETRLDEAIAALSAALGEDKPREPVRVAMVALDAASAGKATLSISYRIRGASWRPVYDARLDTRGAKPSLELVRRAMIRQSSGEDWSNATLTLSTLRIARGTQAPELTSERARFFERPQAVAPAAPVARMLPGHAEPMAMAAAEADLQRRKSSEKEARVAVAEAAASIEASNFQAEFVVPGRVVMPSTGEEKSILLGTGRIEPKLSHRAVPVADPTAYLEAAFTWDGAAPLLAGEVLLNRDGAFIGRGRVKDSAGGEEIRLGFGADDKVKLSRVPLSREAREPGLLGSTRTDDIRFRIDVRNLHAFPVDLVIHERTPISEDQQITIERLPEMTKPDNENVEDRRGVFAWNARLNPQEARSFINAYRLRWPASREIRVAPIPK